MRISHAHHTHITHTETHTHSPCLSQTQSVLDCRHLCWTPSHIHTDFYWSVCVCVCDIVCIRRLLCLDAGVCFCIFDIRVYVPVTSPGGCISVVDKELRMCMRAPFRE